jgi:hypothetical protein
MTTAVTDLSTQKKVPDLRVWGGGGGVSAARAAIARAGRAGGTRALLPLGILLREFPHDFQRPQLLRDLRLCGYNTTQQGRDQFAANARPSCTVITRVLLRRLTCGSAHDKRPPGGRVPRPSQQCISAASQGGAPRLRNCHHRHGDQVGFKCREREFSGVCFHLSGEASKARQKAREL